MWTDGPKVPPHLENYAPRPHRPAHGVGMASPAPRIGMASAKKEINAELKEGRKERRGVTDSVKGNSIQLIANSNPKLHASY